MVVRIAAVLIGLTLVALALALSISPWLALAVPGVALTAIGLLADSRKP